MRQDDDFVALTWDTGRVNLRCDDINIDWPPPPGIRFGEHTAFLLVSHSKLTDEQTKGMKLVARGALYRLREGDPLPESLRAEGEGKQENFQQLSKVMYIDNKLHFVEKFIESD